MPNDNINITPDMLKNLSTILKSSKADESSNSANNYNEKNSSNNSPNKNDKKNNQTTKNTSGNLNFEDFSSSDINIDFDTILKMKSIVEKLNKKDDPRTNLLYSLKPYLNKSRQQKLDKYANILRISDVATLFKDQKKGDEN